MQINRRSFVKSTAASCAALSLSSLQQILPAAENLRALPRSTPEAQGVQSGAILNFLRAAAAGPHEYHSLMIVRHGNVIAEGWWHPYRPEAPQMLYSLSKSFTSTAVGLAVAEGRLSVEDRVIDFFPDQRPAEISEHLAALKVKHLLSMSVGHNQDSTGKLWGQEDWARQFLSLPIENPPGSVFLYNSGATYMCSAIVQKLTKQRLVEYLQPRLFGPLGITGATWETCPRGIDTGGWGLKLTTESLARFGQLYLQGGRWEGQSIVSPAWVEEATTFKIQQPASNLQEARRNSDWHQGYCYQFWRSRHDSYRGDGAYGQYVMVLPKQDAVIAITSETSDMQRQMNLVWEHLLPGMMPEALPSDRVVQAQAEELLSHAMIPPLSGQAQREGLPGAELEFRVDSDAQSLSFAFDDQRCTFVLRDAKGRHSVVCGFGKWIDGETTMPGMPPKLTRGRGSEEGRVVVSGSAGWKDPHTLEMRWQFYETPHHASVLCRFIADFKRVKVTVTDSMAKMSKGGPGLEFEAQAA